MSKYKEERKHPSRKIKKKTVKRNRDFIIKYEFSEKGDRRQSKGKGARVRTTEERNGHTTWERKRRQKK